MEKIHFLALLAISLSPVSSLRLPTLALYERRSWVTGPYVPVLIENGTATVTNPDGRGFFDLKFECNSSYPVQWKYEGHAVRSCPRLLPSFLL
jgi:hypothetical protein